MMKRNIRLTFSIISALLFSGNLFAGAPPVASFFSADTSLCGNGLAHFVNNSKNASHYLWMFGDGGSDTVFNPVHYYTKTGNYTVKLIANNGISIDSIVKTAYIKVNDIPIVSISATDTNLCLNSYDTLTAKGAASYLWSPLSLKTVTIVVNPTTLAHYKVIGTTIAGCTDSATVTIHINALPTVKLSTVKAAICIGDSTTLTASGGNKFDWNPSTTLSSSFIKVGPGVTTTYHVKVTDANGCSDTASAIITVNPLPVLQIKAAHKDLCLGSVDTLTVKGANSFTWYPGSISGPIITVSPTVASTYVVVGTDMNNCINLDSITIIIDTLPVAHAGTNQAVCFGSSAHIGTMPVAGYAYVWNPAFNISSDTSSSTSVNPIFTTEYTLTVTNRATGCSSIDSVNVQVDSLPTFVFWDTATCPNTPIALGPKTKKGYTYQWSPAAGLSSTTVGNPSAILTSSATYTLILTDSTTGCFIMDSTKIGIYTVDSISAIAGRTKVKKGDTAGYIISGIPGFAYQWSVTGATIINGQGTDSITVIWNSSTIDSIKVWTTTTCTDTSKLYVNKPIDALDIYAKIPGIMLYPIPVRDRLSLKLINLQGQTYTTSLLDITGRIVVQPVTNNSDKLLSINTANLPAGMYFAHVQLADGRQLVRTFTVSR